MPEYKPEPDNTDVIARARAQAVASVLLSVSLQDVRTNYGVLAQDQNRSKCQPSLRQCLNCPYHDCIISD